jgi:hypothetical protein
MAADIVNSVGEAHNIREFLIKKSISCLKAAPLTDVPTLTAPMTVLGPSL